MIDFVLAKRDVVTEVSWSMCRQWILDRMMIHIYNEWRFTSMELALISNEINFYRLLSHEIVFGGAHLLH